MHHMEMPHRAVASCSINYSVNLQVAWIWAQTDLYYRLSIVDSLLEISKNVLFYAFFFIWALDVYHYPLKIILFFKLNH